MKILLWNIQWASPKSKRTPYILNTIQKHNPFIICLTETYHGLLQRSGNSMYSDADYGYKIHEGRRKISLWSKNDWESVDSIGDPVLPSGRFISGITTTPIGRINCIGVCIPWADAHVSTGRKDRKRWEDHLQYLKGLSHITNNLPNDIPSVILGDFNQRIPKGSQPQYVYSALFNTFNDKVSIKTSGYIPELEQQSIDHLACTSDIEVIDIKGINKKADDGVSLSDHFGLVITLSKKASE